VPFSIEDNKIQEEKLIKLAKDKKKKNQNAMQETQLVKINTFIDKENMINMKKIEEVRQALRRRYGNRKNIHKIFQLWARTFPNKITVYDAYKMINLLSIPINYNETKAFIASGSNFGNEYLNLEEFANLVYDPIKINLGKDNKKDLFEEKEGDKITNNIMENNMNEYDSRNVEKLKEFISERLRVLNKSIKELSKEKYSFKEDNKNKAYNTNLNLVDYDKFLKGILSLKPSENIGKEKYIKRLFDEYKNDNNLLDIRFFGENTYEKNSKEFMTKFKDRYIETSKEQYNAKLTKLQNYVNENSKRVKP
jgi:ribosomal protein S18